MTKEDLQVLRVQLLSDLKSFLMAQDNCHSTLIVEGYKTKHVRKILDCSLNKLVSLRVARKIRWKKVGGTIYYNKEDVRRLVEEDF